MRPLILFTALLSGCSLAPKYERPAAPVAQTFPGQTTANSPGVSSRQASTVAWTEFYGDARLQALISLALTENRDLRIANLQVDRVRALYNIQRTALIPSLNAKADGTRQRTPGDLNATGSPVTTSTYGVVVEIPSYELDFFGRVASLRDQALQQYLATEEGSRSAQISLISAVARQYLTTLALDEQVALARRTLASADKSYDLNRQSFDAGQASELDLRTADAQRQAVRATVASLRQQRDQAHHALTQLVGAPIPTDLPPAGALGRINLLDDLPIGLPAELLTRRPDVLAAEHTLEAVNANIGVARAAFFPSIKLTASGGTASAELGGLFEGGSGTWKFAPSITVPIFAGGANKARLKIAEVDQEIEVARYQRTVQTAFREVADALTVRSLIDEQIDAQTIRVSAATLREQLSQQRFDAGIDGYLTVLLAQQDRFSAEQALIQARLAKLTNSTALYAALGGGWTTPTTPTEN